VTKVLFASIVAICFVGLGAESAFAQSPPETKTFILVPGIAGDSSDEGHERWINVEALTQTFNPLAKADNICSLNLFKRLDSAGPRLWAAAVTEQVFNQVQVDIVRMLGDTPMKIYEILLGNARVASIKTSSSGFSNLEEVTITADSVALSPRTLTAASGSQSRHRSRVSEPRGAPVARLAERALS